MRSFLKLLSFGAVLALGVATSTGIPAADKEQVLKDRQALMRGQGRQWVIVRNYVEGKADQAAALAAAESLAKSVPKVPDYFPPGTEGPAPDGKYAAKPEIWSQHDKFLAAHKTVLDQVTALNAAIKGGDKAKVEAAFKELDFCNACHKQFRAKLQ